MKAEAVVDELIFSGAFHLHGSRLMASIYPDKVQVSENTDWDLAAEPIDWNIDYVKGFGFKLMDTVQAANYNTALSDVKFIFSLACSDAEVQVQFKSSVERYLDMFKSIPVEDYINYVWKSAPKHGLVKGTPAYEEFDKRRKEYMADRLSNFRYHSLPAGYPTYGVRVADGIRASNEELNRRYLDAIREYNATSRTVTIPPTTLSRAHEQYLRGDWDAEIQTSRPR